MCTNTLESIIQQNIVCIIMYTHDINETNYFTHAVVFLCVYTCLCTIGIFLGTVTS